MGRKNPEDDKLIEREEACLKYGLPIILVILSFFVEFLSRWFSFLSLRVAFWMFWIGASVVSLLGALEVSTSVYHFINEHLCASVRKTKAYKERIEKEEKKIRTLLDFDIGIESDDALIDHYYELGNAEFSKESLAPYVVEWHDHVNEVNRLLEENAKEKENERLEEQKEQLLKEIKDLKKEKKQVSERETYNPKDEAFLKKYENIIHVDATNLAEEQKRLLESVGFVRTHQWCINKRDSVEFLIKPRHNESLSHAYLTSAVFEHVKKLDPEAKLSTTKTADVIFTSKNNCWAVEIETGKVYEKSKQQLLEKVKALDEKFPKKWFFVVTNKNLLTKYHKFGEAIDRSSVISRVDSIFGRV